MNLTLVLTFAVLGEDNHTRVPEAAPGWGVPAAQVLYNKALWDGGTQIVGLRRRPHQLLLSKLLAGHPGPRGIAHRHWTHPILKELRGRGIER